ncbi:O-antigen polymerase [Oceanisphaera sp. W20_SRM_FM3]|uniref:O-antigen polymerase n=1 Tax=Oceanisphaera sp. W20_SRM_FM3 TaxID=3240267 RepID=UPI003F9AD049
MFIYDFINSVNVELYFLTIFSLITVMISIAYFLKQKILHPIFLGDLFFFQSALVYVFHENNNYLMYSLLIIFVYILSRTIGMYLNNKLFFFSCARASRAHLSRKLFLMIVILCSVFSILTFFYLDSLSQINTSFKITWVLEKPILSFFYSFSLIASLVFIPLYFVKQKRSVLDKLLALLVLFIFSYNSVMFHMKGYFIFVLLSLFFYFDCKGKKINLKVIILVLLIALFYLSLFYNLDSYIKLIDRIIKNADGSFIFLEYNLGDGRIFLFYNAYIYFMKFIFFKFLPSHELGQAISSFAPYVYAEGGGVNDHFIIYLFLSTDQQSFQLIMFMAFINVIILPLLSYLKSSKNLFLFGLGGWLYINSFLVFQMPSGFFLSLSKYLSCLILISLIILLYKMLIIKNKAHSK